MTTRATLAFLAFSVVAGCGQLRDAPDDQSSGASAPAVTEAVVEAPRPTPTTPMPEFAAEVVQLVGQDFASLFPAVTEDCVGHLDGVSEYYGADRPGVRAGGWAFNLGEKSTFPLFVATDVSGVIQGGGVGNIPRPDVIAARPGEITSEDSGYEVLVGISSGPVTVYGIEAGTNEACRVGSFPDVSFNG